MVHDDDTGRRVEFTISGTNTLTRPSMPARLPSKKIQDEIIRLGRRRGVDVERIYARYRRKRHDISRAVRARAACVRSGRPPAPTSTRDVPVGHRAYGDSCGATISARA